MGTTKYNTELCDNNMSFDECELAILRHAVDETDELQKQKIANSDDVKRMIHILEDFLVRKKLVCYGGTAINNILPKYAQFYNRDIEVPDYDFFSDNAMEDAKELTDLFFKAGYLETEAKSGVHKGTYKVFVNYIPMADITQLHPDLYESIKKEAIMVAGIKYTPPNYLRMSMFLELSRPAGDVSRWEKVLKRLTLLNTYHPMKSEIDCNSIDFQRRVETVGAEESEKIYFLVRDSFIEQGVVFFGGYASSLYSKYMDKKRKSIMNKIPDFDVLSEDPNRCALIIQEKLEEQGFKNVSIVEHESIDDVIPKHIQITVGKETIAFVFEPVACHNYNTIQIGSQEINVATIDTMLSFYLAFIYANKPYFEKDRILCMAQFLFEVEQKNRLEQKDLLKRFSIKCYGKQPTLETMRAEKAEKFKDLASERNGPEWNEWFFKYAPGAKLSDRTLSQGAIKLSRESKSEEKINSNSKQSEQSPSVKIHKKIKTKYNRSKKHPVYKLSESKSDESSEYEQKPDYEQSSEYEKKPYYKKSPKYKKSESASYDSESYSIPVYKPKRTQRIRKARKPKRNTFRRIFGFK